MMFFLYRFASAVIAPLFLQRHLQRRVSAGKEIKERLNERFGITGVKRPDGKLLWLHAASVGELQSIVPLMEALLKADTDMHILLTTMTVTSCERFESLKLPRVIHQFVPLDVPAAAARFVEHWKPDAAFFVESEIWPNLILEMKKTVRTCGIINGRMSDKSFRFWRYAPGMIRSLLSGLSIYAQSEKDAEKYKQLGGESVSFLGNLKFDAPPLPFDEKELQSLKNAIGNRHVWLAASTHPQEEHDVADLVHFALHAQFPDILTIIVPRHPERGPALAEQCKHCALRSRGDRVTADTQIYIADTIGELGLFYRLSNIVFMGGSFIEHGGQNMLEPARLGCAVLWGKHVFNFEDAARMLQTQNAGLQVENAQALTLRLASLLNSKDEALAMGARAKALMEFQDRVVPRLADAIMNAMQGAPRPL